MKAKPEIRINPATISLNNLKSLFLLSGFRPEIPQSVKPGIILNNDIEKENGKILFSAGSHLLHKELKVLYHLAETSKKFNPEIFITKNNALTDSLRDTIIRDIIHIIDGKKVKDECRMMFRNVEKSFMFYVDELFQSSETVYQLIRMRLLNQLFSPEYRPMLYFYVLSVFLYSLGIIKHSFSLSKLTPEDYLKISHAVFYHNIVVFEKLDTILKVESELILEKYYEENTVFQACDAAWACSGSN